MDVSIIRGAILIGLIIGFIGVFVWAWSNKRTSDFEEAARMPLEEDEPKNESDRQRDSEA